MKNRVIVTLKDHRSGDIQDIEVDLDITAHELFVGLNTAFGWGCSVQDSNDCYLTAENPIALLRGSSLLRNFGLRDGTIIHFKRS